MNIYKLVLESIEQYPRSEPIFIDEIKEYVIKQYKDTEREKVSKNINVILNRLKKECLVKSDCKGVYYRSGISIFGEVGCNQTRLMQLKYLKDRNGNIKGYITGAKLFNRIGLTTQVPNVIDIVTNECKYHKQYDEKLRTYITKPKIMITNENYKYLQFIDILENRDNINIEVKNANEILYKIIQECNLDFEKIIKYARETKSKVAINKIVALAR